MVKTFRTFFAPPSFAAPRGLELEYSPYVCGASNLYSLKYLSCLKLVKENTHDEKVRAFLG